MGRRKLEIKRIEDNNARQMSFTKRRGGLLKKAKELAVLCDVDVAAIVISSRGKLYHHCSNNNLNGILQRYQNHAAIGEGTSKGVCGNQEQYPKYADALSNGELLQIVERDLGGEQCGNQLSVIDLINLEKQLQDTLTQTRSTKTRLLLDSMSSLLEKEKMLAEEKRGLEEKIASSNTIRRPNNMVVDLNFVAECRPITEY